LTSEADFTPNRRTFRLNDDLIGEDVPKSPQMISDLIDQWKSILPSRTMLTA